MTTDKTLCKQLAEAVGAGASPLVPEIFSVLVNDEEAKVLLFASPPATAEELAAKSGLALADVEAMMDSLFHRGLIFKATRGGERKFYRVKNIPQMHDSTTLTPGISRDVLDLWKRYMETEWPSTARSWISCRIHHARPARHEGIESQSQVLPYEDVVKVIEGQDALRDQLLLPGHRRRLWKAPGGLYAVDRAAEYNIERARGVPFPKRRPWRSSENVKKRAVHTVDNDSCRPCDLQLLPRLLPHWAIMKGPKKWVAPSRYTAVVDADLCIGCEACVDRCFFDALAVPEDTAVVDPDKCLGCGVCTVSCPTEALKLKEIRSADFVPA
jgi:NAD-dependent dihydropyrimidine dehydrogenase PreA subunit